MKSATWKVKALACSAVLAAAVLAPVSPASAGLLVQSARSCNANTLSQPFAQFGDSSWYTDVPGGSFESGSQAWTLGGNAKVVSGNESYYIRSRSDARSLSLPAGSVATSPAMCVGLGEPTLRYMAKQSGSLLGLTGAMTVSVLTETSLGLTVEVPLLPGLLTTSWKPGTITPVVANLLPLLPNDKTPVAFRFRAVTGNWQLDDVYVDPYRSR